MANFVEQATLKVRDESSAQIAKINAELRKLFATAKSLKSQSIKFNVNTAGLDAAVGKITRLNAQLGKLKSGKLSINTAGLDAALGKVNTLNSRLGRLQSHKLSINTAGLDAALGKINTLNTRLNALQGRRAINVATPTTPLAPRAAPVTPGGIRSIPGPGAFPGGRGFITGLGLGFGGVVVSLSAVEGAGYAAAAALKSVAVAAASRDRTALQMNVLASEAQRKVFDAMPQPKDMPLPLSTDQYNQLRSSLLGDVQGNERERAAAASMVTDELVRNYIPRLFAQDPTKSKSEVLEGVRQLIKGINLASTELTEDVKDTKGKRVIDPRTGLPQQKFSQEGQRVMNAAIRAMSVDPEVTPQLIKTVLANAKTAALTLNEEGLTRLFINAGARGQRAGNEAYRAAMTMIGTVDNKSLNEGLARMGLFKETSAQLKRKPISKARAKRGEKGAIIPGANEPIGGWKAWQENPAQALRDYFVPKMVKDVLGKDASEAFVKANQEQTKEIERAREESKRTGKYVEPRRIPGAELTGEQGLMTPGQIQAYIVQQFPSMNAAARQGIFDYISGFDQLFSTLNQSAVGAFQSVPDAIKQSWTAAAENVQTAWTNAAAQFGAALAKYLNLPEKTQSVADWINQNPNAAVGGAIFTGAAAVGGAGYFLQRWLAAKGIATGAAATGAAVAGAAAPTTAIGVAGTAVAGGVLSRLIPTITNKVLGPLGFLLDMMGPAGGVSNLPQLERIIEANQVYNNSLRQMQEVQERLRTASDPAEIATLSHTIETLKKNIAAAEEVLRTSGSRLVAPTVPPVVPPGAAAFPPAEVTAKAVEQPDWVPLQVEQPSWVPLQIEQPSWLESLLTQLQRSDAIKLPESTMPATDLQTAVTMLVTAQQGFSSSIGTLSETSGTFASVFSSGAAAIVSAGESAISVMQGGATGVGSSIGSAALAVIQGASINVNVNANVSGAGKVDTGDSKPAQ